MTIKPIIDVNNSVKQTEEILRLCQNLYQLLTISHLVKAKEKQECYPIKSQNFLKTKEM